MAAPIINTSEITRSVLMPRMAAIRRSCWVARQTRPNCVWLIIQLSTTMPTKAASRMKIFGPGDLHHAISYRKPQYAVHQRRDPLLIWALTQLDVVFVKISDMPIAEISGARRVELRSGR